MRLLDLFCCQGGAARGYADAGFDVTGVDIFPQPKYPYEFFNGDALAYLAVFGSTFDFIHASPPCQKYTKATKLRGNTHPDLIAPVRELLIKTGKPWVMENVVGAPLINPIELCGTMFGLKTYRHRLFESNFPIIAPPHRHHDSSSVKMGRPVKRGEYIHIVGHFSNVPYGREVMEMPWANQYGLAQAIPPAYTRHIGGQFLTAATPPQQER